MGKRIIKECRVRCKRLLEQGETQSSLAALAGVHQSTISRFVNGGFLPAEALGKLIERTHGRELRPCL